MVGGNATTVVVTLVAVVLVLVLVLDDEVVLEISVDITFVCEEVVLQIRAGISCGFVFGKTRMRNKETLSVSYMHCLR